MFAPLDSAPVVKEAFSRLLLESSMPVLPGLLKLQSPFLALLEKAMLVLWSLPELWGHFPGLKSSSKLMEQVSFLVQWEPVPVAALLLWTLETAETGQRVVEL